MIASNASFFSSAVKVVGVVSLSVGFVTDDVVVVLDGVTGACVVEATAGATVGLAGVVWAGDAIGSCGGTGCVGG